MENVSAADLGGLSKRCAWAHESSDSVSLSDDDEFDSLVVCVWRSEKCIYTYISIHIYSSLTHLWCVCGGRCDGLVHVRGWSSVLKARRAWCCFLGLRMCACI